MKWLMTLEFFAILTLSGQTQLDWTTQIRSKPIKSGTVLPAACSVGDLFLKTDATVGRNLYACLSRNAWTLQSGGSSTGSLTIAANGSTLGSESVLNFTGGTGIIYAIADTGTRFDIATMMDAAIVQTHASAQAGSDLFCQSQSGSGQSYSCIVTPMISTTTKGMVIHWTPDVTATGGATTLAMNTLDPITVKRPDGISDPTALDIVAGQMALIWYDGSIFRLITTDDRVGNGAAQPACNAGLRGKMWFNPGTTGIKDSLAICSKDASNLYAWRTLL